MSLHVKMIGIGSGNPEHMTVQGIKALNLADIILIPRKGVQKADLAELRREICERFLDNSTTRILEFDLPARKGAEATQAYLRDVDQWHAQIAKIYAQQFAAALSASEKDCTIALLVWGDPSLYDSTLRILDRVHIEINFVLEVIPGVTSVQTLTARHAIPLHPAAEPVLFTTGRRLAEDIQRGVENLVVMLDGNTSFSELPDATRHNYEIYWGAYVGMPQEVLIHGAVDEVMEEIQQCRARQREAHGWIMDVYLLKRRT
ncbi:precorrin-6a synthase [gamma proteobacterium HdN1]|nr:precorrin-6a synthase [gamma proteobacterium HdN1]